MPPRRYRNLKREPVEAGTMCASMAAAATMLGVSWQVLRHMEDMGRIVKEAGGWNVAEIQKVLIKEDDDRARSQRERVKAAKVSPWLDRKRQLETELLDLELATTRGELVQLSSVQDALVELSASVNEWALSIGDRLSVRLCGLGQADLKKELDAEGLEILSRLRAAAESISVLTMADMRKS